MEESSSGVVPGAGSPESDPDVSVTGLDGDLAADVPGAVGLDVLEVLECCSLLVGLGSADASSSLASRARDRNFSVV